MKKRTGLGIAGAAIVLVAVAAAVGGMAPDDMEPEPVETVAADVIMPTKSSRPGCEADDECYIPPQFSVRAGESVSWLNDDSAFHSVTSGVYGEATGLFDSGYMDPGEVFVYVFEEPGTYVYHCTLHEWMYGTVQVG